MTEKSILYQPSNGSEMDYFSAQFCFKCSKMSVSCEAKNQCGIFRNVLCYDVKDKEYPKQWRYVDDKPCCTSFVDRDKANEARRKSRVHRPKIDKHTMNLF